MNTRNIRVGLLVVVLMALLTLPGVGTTFAQADSTPAASPDATPEAPEIAFSSAPAGESDLSPFRFELDAGSITEATLVVGNDAETPVELRSYAADVTTAINGGYQVAPENDGPGEVAAWLSVPADAYTVEPGENVSIEVTLTVPEGTLPGEYMAALATETVESAAIDGSATFRQITRKANAVVIMVPGPVVAGFELGAPSIEIAADSTTVIVPIENTGNARVHPQGTIVISDDAGVPVVSIPISMGSVYAWDATTIQSTFAMALPEGTYTVAVDLVDDATGATATLPGTIVVATIVRS